MSSASPLLLIAAVGAVGVLHTIVPDHWAPIAVIARQRGWSKGETARAALQAGTGHILSTLAIALAAWIAGVSFAARFGHLVDVASSLALIGLGGWIAVSAWRELHPPPDPRRSHGADHSHSHTHSHPHHHPHPHSDAGDGKWAEAAAAMAGDRLYAPLRDAAAVQSRHTHLHRHGRGAAHLHWHDHTAVTLHPILALFASEPPLHQHRHKTTARTALLLILGSSPMVEGIPAFFAAARYGGGVIAAMSAVFALSTIATYVALCVYSSAGLQRLRLGSVERYGEVLSGAVIALVGVIFGLWQAV